MTALPYPIPQQLLVNTLWVDAYRECLAFHKRAEVSTSLLAGSKLAPLTCARFLGYMILEAPTDEGRIAFSAELLACTTDEQRMELAEAYVHCFMACFRAATGHTPTPSRHPSQPFNNVHEVGEYLREKVPQTHKVAKEKALYRDSFRCPITDAYDIGTWDRYPHLIPNDEPLTPTNCAHIFDESVGLKSDYRTWSMIHRFGNISIANELNGTNVHRLENLITMAVDMHCLFDRFFLWLEATARPFLVSEIDSCLIQLTGQEIDNQYRAAAISPKLLTRLQSTKVALTTPDGVDFPVPDARYLRLHGACCKILHFSGAGRYVENLYEELENTMVLAEDGSTPEVLDFAFARISIRQCIC